MRICERCGASQLADDWRCQGCDKAIPLIGGFRAFAPELATEGPGFDDSYFAELATLEEGSFWFRARNELILWALRKYFVSAASFLEIGCGTGYVLGAVSAEIPAARLVGSELFVSGLNIAAKRVPTAEFYQIDARSIPFRNAFDVIGAFDVIEHVDDDRRVLQQVAAALVPGGGVIVTVPQHPSMWSPQDDFAHHVRRYTAREVTRKLRDAGLEVVRCTSFMSLLLPLMFVARRRSRATGGNELDVMAELRQPRMISGALEYALGFERALIRRGMSFPAGGSLLVVARKAGLPEESG